MSQSSSEDSPLQQINDINDIKVGRDFIYAPSFKGITTPTIDLSTIITRKLNRSSPYQGLKKFNLQNRDLFFGRDKTIDDLLQIVNKSDLNLVLGASGSGKSSVIRAGLIPELKKSLGSQTFFHFIFRPDRDPFDSLYRCLRSELTQYSFSESEAKIALNAKADTLSKVIENLKNPEERWLIFIDQFEELFTNCDDLVKQNNFIQGLIQVAKSGDNSVKILLAMRSDLYTENLSSYPELWEIVTHNNYIMKEMCPDELKKVMEQPAANHGVMFEEGLVEQIIKEVDGKGYLPLLQYTLDLLWISQYSTIEKEDSSLITNRILSKKSYTTLGGVRGALQKRINKIYGDRTDEQIVIKQIFLKLVNIVETNLGSQVVSRRVYRNEFGDELEKTLDYLIKQNLLVGSNEDSDIQIINSCSQLATVDIAHEVLISSWDILKIWIEEEKEAIILKNFLASELKRWQLINSKDEIKAEDELLKGYRLDQALEFINKNAFQNIGGLKKEEKVFIETSIKLRERQQEKDINESRDARIKKAAVVFALIGLAIGCIGILTYQKYGVCPVEKGLIGETTGKNTCFRKLITSGDKNVFFSSKNLSLENGIEAFKKKDYKNAITLFAKATNGDITDPVSRIFYNNAKAQQREIEMEKPNSFFGFDSISQKQQTFKLAVVTSIDSYEIGAKEVLRGVADAQEDFNSHQNSADPLMEIVIANDGNEPEAAKKVAQDLLDDKTILGIMGHYASENTYGALEVYKGKGKEIAIVSSTSSSSVLKSDNFFRTIGNTKKAAEKYVEKIRELNLKDVAIFFAKDSKYSEQLKIDFVAAYGKSIPEEHIINIADTKFDVKAKVHTILGYSKPTAMLIFTSVGTNSLGLEIAKEFTENNKNGKNIKLFVSMSLSEAEIQNRANLALAKEIQMVILCTYNDKSGFYNYYINGSKSKGEKDKKGALERWNLKEINWRTVTSYDAIQVFGEAFTDSRLNHQQHPSNKMIERTDVLNKIRKVKSSSKTSPDSLEWSEDDRSNNKREYCLIKFDKTK